MIMYLYISVGRNIHWQHRYTWVILVTVWTDIKEIQLLFCIGPYLIQNKTSSVISNAYLQCYLNSSPWQISTPDLWVGPLTKGSLNNSRAVIIDIDSWQWGRKGVPQYQGMQYFVKFNHYLVNLVTSPWILHGDGIFFHKVHHQMKVKWGSKLVLPNPYFAFSAIHPWTLPKDRQ